MQAPAEALPFPDDSFDTAVATLALCTVDDPHRAIGELRRVLRPGGQLLFLEHVRSDDPKLARWQDRAIPLWRRSVTAVTATGRQPTRSGTRASRSRSSIPGEPAEVASARPAADSRLGRVTLTELRREPGCAFCAIVHGEAPAHVVLEDEQTIAFLDNRPLFPGHTLLIPREPRRHAAGPARRAARPAVRATRGCCARAMVHGLRRGGLVRRAQQPRQPERPPPARARRPAPPQGRPARILLAADEVPRRGPRSRGRARGCGPRRLAERGR